MGLFTNLEIMIMVSVIGFLVFVILLLSILEIISKKKESKSIEVEEEAEEKEIIETSNSTPKVVEVEAEVNNALDEEITLETLENDINSLTEAIPETSEVKEEVSTFDVIETPSANNTIIEQLEDIESKMNIVPEEEEIEVLELEPNVPDNAKNAYVELEKIKEELEHPVSLEATISNLESQEEESAIISYQELLSFTSEMQAITDEDIGDEPISITEVYEKFTGEKMESPSINDIYEASVKSGIETENLNEIQLENTANLEKLDKEIRKTNKVLNMLNELKKNLD